MQYWASRLVSAGAALCGSWGASPQSPSKTEKGGKIWAEAPKFWKFLAFLGKSWESFSSKFGKVGNFPLPKCFLLAASGFQYFWMLTSNPLLPLGTAEAILSRLRSKIKIRSFQNTGGVWKLIQIFYQSTFPARKYSSSSVNIKKTAMSSNLSNLLMSILKCIHLWAKDVSESKMRWWCKTLKMIENSRWWYECFVSNKLIH